MKKQVLSLFILFCFLSFTKNELNIVKKFIRISNTYDFKKISTIVSSNYQETFIDGSVEIKSLDDLKKRFEWREIMNSKVTLKDLKIGDKKGQVIAIESNRNYIDDMLDRKSRTLKIIYQVNNNRIINAVIDTIPGHKELSIVNFKKWEEFIAFCDKNNLNTNNPIDDKAVAKRLRKNLLLYSKNKKR
ncbi:hypothetical protein GTQ40_12260 [Flavobacteriaceae bacterium R38]|nr:hypothetical protein [Flavobacteriaceae bacterium R38]